MTVRCIVPVTLDTWMRWSALISVMLERRFRIERHAARWYPRRYLKIPLNVIVSYYSSKEVAHYHDVAWVQDVCPVSRLYGRDSVHGTDLHALTRLSEPFRNDTGSIPHAWGLRHLGYLTTRRRLASFYLCGDVFVYLCLCVGLCHFVISAAADWPIIYASNVIDIICLYIYIFILYKYICR